MKTQILLTFINSQIVTTSVLSLLLGFPLAALADYIPSPDQKPPSDYTRSGGTRTGGCPQLIALAPQQYVGQTASLRPTFAWFISKSQSVEFRLFEFDANSIPQQIGEPIDLPSSAGVTKLKLTESYPELTVGKKYLWQVTGDCSQADVMDRAEFTVVRMSDGLTKNLSQIGDASQRADLYGKAGLWYDAFAEALTLAPEGKLGNLGSTFLLDLAQWEVPKSTSILPETERRELQQATDSLKQIALEQK
jgi:hypothetical protein